MSFLGNNLAAIRYGAIVDIGSGSVLVAIIASDPNKTHPDVLWSRREYAPLKNISSITESAKNVMASLLNALMYLDSEGRAVLREKTGKNKLPETQVTIAAPWSYTVTKSISYQHEEVFTLSTDLVEELLRTAHKKIEEELVENEHAHDFGLSVVTRSTIGIIANGYNVIVPDNQQVKTLQIIEASAVVQDYLIETIHEVKNKILPGTNLKIYSFILIFYYIIKEMFPETSEFCLVDITYEATEIGIVRDGILNYCTHTPFGAFSLAREISAILKVPLEEAYGYLQQEDPLTLLGSYSASQQKEVSLVFSKYQDKLTDLFKETGDTLSIPKKIFLHGNLATEPFFRMKTAAAAKKTTNNSHAVYPISEEMLNKHYQDIEKTSFTTSNQDTALLISAQFFHTEVFHDKFEQF